MPEELLIEPFGIEILRMVNKPLMNLSLLIEPFGIEIFDGRRLRECDFNLLIEPFGIEMEFNRVKSVTFCNF